MYFKLYRHPGLLVVVGVVVLFFAQPGWSCDCVGPVGKKALSGSAAMFAGKAIRVEFLEPDEQAKEPKILVTFEVHEVWKGPVQRVLRLRTRYNKWTCDGYYFKEGLSYLVTAYEVKTHDGDVELSNVNICGATRDLIGAEDVLRSLGPGEVPVEKPKP